MFLKLKMEKLYVIPIAAIGKFSTVLTSHWMLLHILRAIGGFV
jgi:hypothetical protein